MRVRFVIRKARINQIGQCPINCRITIDSEKANEFAVGISVDPAKWDSKQQRIKGATAKVMDMNRRLDMVRSELDEIYLAARSRGNRLSAAEVKDIYSGKKDIVCGLKKMSDTYLEVLKTKDRSHATIMRYTRCFKYLQQFMKKDMMVDRIEKRHVSGFWLWLKEKKYENDYCNKVVQANISLFNYGIEMGLIERNPFAGITLEWKKEIDITFLTLEEIEAIKNTVWSEKLQRVADSFLFMCYTGLHISDYIASENQQTYFIGETEWMQIRRTKTHIKATFPLHSYAKQIIEKYGGIDKLPRISGQKSNDHLKIIGERIGTSKNMTNKLARKTFTNMALNEYNMSMESVAAMLGHVSTKQVKHYGAVSERRIISEWGDK